MSDIKILVCCHTPARVPEHPLLLPVQVGAERASERFPGFAHDDDGENISEKNPSYCELTAQYWAWKNLEADYYGLFHYRRYLYPDAGAKRPYIIRRRPDASTLDALGFDRLSGVVEQNDMILVRPNNMYVTVREHYAQSGYHHLEDLSRMERILEEREPDFTEAKERCFSETSIHFGNMFIMRSEWFRRYCEWLFPLLEAFDTQSDLSAYGPQERRVDGYLAERLLGVFYTRFRDQIRTAELPMVFFDEENGRIDRRRRAAYWLIPPGTRRRAAVKRWTGGWMG